MGMKKHNVALGLVSELLIITVVCLVLGLSVGGIIAQPIVDLFLQVQIQAAEAAGGFRTSREARTAYDNEETAQQQERLPVSHINAQLDFNSLWQITLISLTLCMAASLMAIKQITRYEPIKILYERS
jgi:putative ABC transport system permease protein